jgi:outer membrane murein-binding lipoprotein Lpp
MLYFLEKLFFPMAFSNRVYLKIIANRQEIIMAKIDDLGTAVTQLSAKVDEVIVKIAELKAAGTNIDPQLDAAILAINEATGKLNTAIQ